MTAPTELIARLVDVLRRSDLDYCESHGVAQASIEEWDEVLADAEDWLEDARGGA